MPSPPPHSKEIRPLIILNHYQYDGAPHHTTKCFWSACCCTNDEGYRQNPSFHSVSLSEGYSLRWVFIFYFFVHLSWISSRFLFIKKQTLVSTKRVSLNCTVYTQPVKSAFVTKSMTAVLLRVCFPMKLLLFFVHFWDSFHHHITYSYLTSSCVGTS